MDLNSDIDHNVGEEVEDVYTATEEDNTLEFENSDYDSGKMVGGEQSVQSSL